MIKIRGYSQHHHSASVLMLWIPPDYNCSHLIMHEFQVISTYLVHILQKDDSIFQNIMIHQSKKLVCTVYVRFAHLSDVIKSSRCSNFVQLTHFRTIIQLIRNLRMDQRQGKFTWIYYNHVNQYASILNKTEYRRIFQAVSIPLKEQNKGLSHKNFSQLKREEVEVVAWLTCIP